MMLQTILCYRLLCTITISGRDKKQSSARVCFHGSKYFSHKEQLRNEIIQPPCAILEAELKL